LIFGSGPSFPGAPPAFVAPAVGLGGSALFLVVAYGTWRGRRPHRAPHLRLEVRPLEVHRGGRVEVDAILRTGAGVAERVDVGLVCVEVYDEWSRGSNLDSVGDPHRRFIRQDSAYAHWETIDTRAGAASLRIDVPSEAPFSYEGEALSFAWRVAARSARSERVVFEPIWVLP